MKLVDFTQMTDLYDEILKNNSKSVSEFCEQLVTETSLRDDFLQEYVDEIVDSMVHKDIVRAYSQLLLEGLYKKVDNDQDEQIVKECAGVFPYVLERFGVDLTM